MPTLYPVSRSRHGSQRWKRHTNYQFAASHHFTSLVMAEMSKALLELPIGFAKNNESFLPICLMGFQAGQNLFINAEGQWQGNYIPASFRSHPFQLAKNESGELMLCFDEDSGLLSSHAEDEQFFSEEGKPSTAIQEILDFLNKIEGNRSATQRACDALAKYQLMEPWPLSVQKDDKTVPVEGLYRVKENLLNQLDGDALREIQHEGGMMVAYCQLLSMQQINRLAERAKAASAMPSPAEQPSIKLPSDDSGISFDDLL